MSLAAGPADILRFVADRKGAATLVTLIAVTGSASRAVGAHMAVDGDGDSCGSFSGGCIEAAVIAEARDVLASGRGRIVRFGAGSPYIDVRLPCGGGIDLLFTPKPDADIVAAMLAAIAERQVFSMAISTAGIGLAAGSWANGAFKAVYCPPLRILALGQGEELSAFVRLANAYGTETVAMAPQERVDRLGELAPARIVPIRTRRDLPPVHSDPWTAIVFLFHDRDWEEFLLPQALALEGFYHGAIGSPRTQAARRQALLASGVPTPIIAKLRPVVGLIPATRDPASLALSIFSEMVADYNALVAHAPGVRTSESRTR